MISKILTFIMIATSFSVLASDANEWKLVRDKKGIEVYNRKIEGNDFKEFRAEADIQANLTSIIALFTDTSVGTQWVENIDKMEEIEHFSEVHTVTKTYTKAPWPVSDREAIVENFIEQDPNTLTVMITQHGIPNYQPNDDKRIVRVAHLESRWILTPLDNNTTHISYQVLSDPGGSIPSWLINMVAVSQPYNTLRGLSEMLDSGEYTDSRLNFIENYTSL
ncbi:START domain-containing protein [Vibrio crassostreae]|uniref:START domain-containing protein n=1 Tax=Vibrio crassostreae TaxID=246167 RepID=UPI001046659C|nr:START domain-containing protein [Vibrio crassostreae]TCO05254.1 START domain-containing protein [Vibrio crassostreae]CAK1849238.1 START domain-containing protein [Vibrio crassostreae]CAK1856302.1 START domain-containing protein [Vibrio crassostreae]CAK1857513.1 START domain-containing protein [Vibrio crassostreae]CAK2650935.1 START domain-containing protein [Vibrio crassostreae]